MWRGRCHTKSGAKDLTFSIFSGILNQSERAAAEATRLRAELARLKEGK